MRTIIHIGQHKTGTTSIQHYLRQNTETLKDRGLYVPESLCGYTNLSHFILNVYALSHKRLSWSKEKLLATEPASFFQDLPKRLVSSIDDHYQKAIKVKCKDVIWTNEGLYLLNSVDEYQNLFDLFTKYSTEIICLCCFRKVDSYRKSYIQQQQKLGLTQIIDNCDSYRYYELDSWLFDYERKKKILSHVFNETFYLSYNEEDMVGDFMREIGYPVSDSKSVRLNVS